MPLDGLPQDPAVIRQILENAASEAIIRARNYEFPRQIPEVFEGHAHTVEGAFVGFVPLLKKAILLLLQGLALLTSSIMMYSIFYLLAMPGHHATEKIYFDYSGTSKHPAPFCENNLTVGMETSFGPDTFFPWAVADLFSRHSQWEAFHEEVTPPPLTKTRILGQRTPYYIDVALDLPESDINRQNGIFGVSVDLQAMDGARLASSLRSARLPHESGWISVVRKIIWLVPMLLGVIEESRTVVVPSFRFFVESVEKPLRFVTVKLVKTNTMNAVTITKESVEVVRGEVRIGRELTKFQMLLKEWFYTCGVIGVAILFLVQVLSIVGIRLARDARKQREVLDDASANLNFDGSFGEIHNEQLHGQQPQGGQDEWEDLPQPSHPSDPNDPVSTNVPDAPGSSLATDAEELSEQINRSQTPPLSTEGA